MLYILAGVFPPTKIRRNSAILPSQSHSMTMIFKLFLVQCPLFPGKSECKQIKKLLVFENSGVLGRKTGFKAGLRVLVESSLENQHFFLITNKSSLFHSVPLAGSVASGTKRQTGLACRILGNLLSSVSNWFCKFSKIKKLKKKNSTSA